MTDRRKTGPRIRGSLPPSRGRPRKPNILVLSLGMVPQVVTETLWVLLRRDPPFVPEEIHLVTTGEGRKRIEADLLGRNGGPNRLRELAAEFDGIVLPEPEIHAIEEDDIRDDASSTAFGDLVVNVVRDITDRHPDARIHASLAGGRKTMSFYMGYALSLFGGLEDELSHVLVSPPVFESSREFWWKYRTPRRIEGYDTEKRQKVLVDTRDATIDLAPIPFLALRHVREWRVLAEPGKGFREVVERKHLAIAGPTLRFRDDTRTVEIGGKLTVKLQALQYALYRLLAEAWHEQRPGVGPGGAGEEHRGWLDWAALMDPVVLERFAELYDRVGGRGHADKVDYQDLARRARSGHVAERPSEDVSNVLYRRLNPTITKLIGALAEGVPDLALLDFVQVKDRKVRRERKAFGLSLIDPANIEFDDG